VWADSDDSARTLTWSEAKILVQLNLRQDPVAASVKLNVWLQIKVQKRSLKMTLSEIIYSVKFVECNECSLGCARWEQWLSEPWIEARPKFFKILQVPVAVSVKLNFWLQIKVKKSS